jgi:hypothetical protein
MWAMFEGPAVVIVWLLTPAIIVIGSLGAGLPFHVIIKLWTGMRGRHLKT